MENRNFKQWCGQFVLRVHRTTETMELEEKVDQRCFRQASMSILGENRASASCSLKVKAMSMCSDCVIEAFNDSYAKYLSQRQQKIWEELIHTSDLTMRTSLVALVWKLQMPKVIRRWMTIWIELEIHIFSISLQNIFCNLSSILWDYICDWIKFIHTASAAVQFH